MYGNGKKGLYDNLHFQAMVFSCKSILRGGGFQMNQPFLIMGRHNLHVTIQTLEQTT
jgi:hypothetical protein